MPISQFHSAVAKIPQNIYISQFYLLFQAISVVVCSYLNILKQLSLGRRMCR